MMTQLVRWQPMRDLDALMGDFERWFGSMPRHLGHDGGPRRFVPACEVLERDDETVLRFDIPGVDPEHDLEVTVEGETLRVSGERKEGSEGAPAQARYGEAVFGSFERCLTLPEGAEHDRIRAHYARGVLEVAIAKGARPEAKKIPVTHAVTDFETPVTAATA